MPISTYLRSVSITNTRKNSGGNFPTYNYVSFSLDETPRRYSSTCNPRNTSGNSYNSNTRPDSNTDTARKTQDCKNRRPVPNICLLSRMEHGTK